MSVRGGWLRALWVSIAIAHGMGCSGSKPPPSSTPKPHARPATQPPAAPSARAMLYEQPQSCQPPLTWEDGTAIEVSQLCPDEPAFFFHERACCRYQNGCLAPENAARYDELEQCEKVRMTVEELSKRPPVCKAAELVWQPSFCVFAGCEHGQFVTPKQQSADCQRPLGLNLDFELDQKVLSTNHIGRIENFATMANVLGVAKLRVEGVQSYDEKPDQKSKTPLSLQRAIAVRDALARMTRVPIEVEDGGTTSRTRGSPNLFRNVSVTMAPLGNEHKPAQTAPFTLPWVYCESSVTVRTQIGLTKHDGDVLVEVCRDKACSRGIIDSTYWAAWPGGGGETMKGDFEATLSLNGTRQQAIRNGLHHLSSTGMIRELDGEKPAFFHFEVWFRDPALSEASTYSVRLLRRRVEVALEWSGKLTFERIFRHPTRDPVPCLRAELEIPMTRHSLR